MAYKIKNPYKTHIMDLNLMDVSHYKASLFNKAEIVFFVFFMIAVLGACLAPFMPEMTFFAECQNIPGGDICSITFK